jgi:hypothetical protein
MKKALQGCLIGLIAVIVVIVLAFGILVVTTTPLSAWFYQHNYYFQDVVNMVRGHY